MSPLSVEPVESEDTPAKDAPAPSPPQQLPYESALSPISRRQFRLLFMLTVINTLLLFFFVAGPGISRITGGWWQDYKQWRADRAAAPAEKPQAQQKFAADFQAGLQFGAPENQVVYEEDTVRAAKLLAGGSDYARVRSGSSSVYLTPAPWQGPVVRKSTALPAPFQDNRGSIVFLHSRMTPGGVEMVVRVELEAEAQIKREDYPGPDRHFRISNWRALISQALKTKPVGELESGTSRALIVAVPTPDKRTSITWIAGPGETWETGRIESEPKDVLRIFAGQPDPKNASHFTIAYELDGKPGIIDGWLLKDETVALEPRQGRITRDNGNGRDRMWDMYAVPPATRPLAPPDLPPAPVRKN